MLVAILVRGQWLAQVKEHFIININSLNTFVLQCQRLCSLLILKAIKQTLRLFHPVYPRDRNLAHM